MKQTSKKKKQPSSHDSLKRNEILLTAKLRVERFRSILKIFDFLHLLLDSNKIPLSFDNKDDLEKSQTNLLILIISYIFSLFDDRGTNILNLTALMKHDNTKKLLNEISTDWQVFGPQLKRIRHNIGFHGGGFSQLDNSYMAFKQMHQQGLSRLVQFMKKIELLDDVLEQEINGYN